MSSSAVALTRGGLLHFDDHLDLDEGAERQRIDAEGSTGVTTSIAEDGDQEIGAAVHHLGLILELVGAIDETADPHDAFNPGEIADLGLERGKQRQGGEFGRLDGVLFGGAAADLARDNLACGVARYVAREKDQIAGAYGGHVVGDGRVGDGQAETQFLEPILRRAGKGGRGEERDEQGEAKRARRHGDVSLRLRPRLAS